jgi:hypothetical protein
MDSLKIAIADLVQAIEHALHDDDPYDNELSAFYDARSKLVSAIFAKLELIFMTNNQSILTDMVDIYNSADDSIKEDMIYDKIGIVINLLKDKYNVKL